jgi:hypothetical protein
MPLDLTHLPVAVTVADNTATATSIRATEEPRLIVLSDGTNGAGGQLV